VTLHQADVEQQSVKLSQNHDAVVQTNCQLNVPPNCVVSRGHASMPAQRLPNVNFDSRSRPCTKVYSVGGLMGNRLADCAVGGVLASGEPQQSVPAHVVTGSMYKDVSQWPSPQTGPAVLQHNKSADWSTGQQLASACDINRPAWVSQHPPATVNGIDNIPRSNYVAVVPPQAYAPRGCGQMPSPLWSATIPAARLHDGSSPVNVRQLWMRVGPRQQHHQQVVCGTGQNGVNMSPTPNMSVRVGPNNVSPVIWQPRFASPSLTSVRLPVPAAHVTAAAAECMSVASAAESPRVTGPACSPVATSVTDSSLLRSNTIGRIYQLPATTAAVTTGMCETCVAMPMSVSSSVTMSSQSTVSTKLAVKPALKQAVITSSQPENERTYVAGRRYTVTKEDGVTVEGIWDGKYLTVLPTSAAKSTASETSG